MKCSKIHYPTAIIFLVLCVLSGGNALSCSEIYLDSQKVSARNFDFMFGDGIALVFPRGEQHESGYAVQGETKKSWTSTYGSVSFLVKLPGSGNTPGNDYVLAGVDAMNEKGFKVGTYFLETSAFPQGKNDTTLSITSLMQYLLDNFETVEGAVNDLQHPDYRVIPVPTGSVEVKLHLYLHDAAGESAIVEFLDGKVVVHQNPEIPVLTDTAYEESLAELKNYAEFGGNRYIPGGNESPERFVRGAFYHKHLPEPASTREAINSGLAVVQILSVSPKFAHGCTQWTIVSDIQGKKIFFRTLNNPSLSFMDLSSMDFSKGQPVRTIDFTREELAGDVAACCIAGQ